MHARRLHSATVPAPHAEKHEVPESSSAQILDQRSPQGAASAAGDWGSSFHGLKSSSFVALTEDSSLNKHSIMLIFVSGFILLLFLCICCWWFEALSSRKTQERQPHLHNGRVIYEWDQDAQQANVYIKPPGGLQKSDFEITIMPHDIIVGRKGKKPFLRDQLYDEVNADASSWTIRTNGELVIHLVKVRRSEWPVVCLHQKPHSASSAQSSS